MAKVPGLSLSTRELQFFLNAHRNREMGQMPQYEQWDVDSSNYGLEYVLIPGAYYEDLGVKSKYLGKMGNYIVEIRGYSRSTKSKGAFVGISSFGWAVHSLTGTVQWDYSAREVDGPVYGFRTAEKLAVRSLTPSQINDAFRPDSDRKAKKDLFTGRPI